MNDRFPDYSIEEMYPAIAQALMRCLPTEWQRATLVFEWLAADTVNSSATYVDRTDTEQWVLSLRPGGPVIPHMFVSLAKRMDEAGHPPWQKATFTLTRSGQFDLDFVYPDDPAATEQGEG